MHPFQILRRPVITEKSTLLSEQGSYVFEVVQEGDQARYQKSRRGCVRRDGRSGFTRWPSEGKRKRFGPRISTQRSWKKAIVTLTPGDSITLFEGV